MSVFLSFIILINTVQSFYICCFREKAIRERVLFLSKCTANDLIQELGRLYRDHKGKSCRILPSWNGLISTYSLKGLQFAAICLGGPTLATICYAMCMNYKQLSSGAPDLLLVRAQLCPSSTSDSVVPSVTVPMSYFLGEDWNQRKSSSRRRSSGWDEENLLDAPGDGDREGNGGRWGKNNRRGRNSSKRSFARTFSSTGESGDAGEGGDTNGGGNDKETVEDSMFGGTIPPPDEQDLTIPWPGANNDVEQDVSEQLKDIVKKYANNCENESAVLTLLRDSNVEWKWKFEAMFVEVKGPTDHLAYKQLLWLKLLSLPHSNNQTKAFVCHVKEK